MEHGESALGAQGTIGSMSRAALPEGVGPPHIAPLSSGWLPQAYAQIGGVQMVAEGGECYYAPQRASGIRFLRQLPNHVAVVVFSVDEAMSSVDDLLKCIPSVFILSKRNEMVRTD
jgi:hypothetical protein